MNRREFIGSSLSVCVSAAISRGAIAAPAAAPRSGAVSPSKPRCGTRSPSPEDWQAMAKAVSKLEAAGFAPTKKIVPIRFHVIHDGPKGTLSEDRLADQVDLLNEVFEPALLKFDILDIDRHDNRCWFEHAAPASSIELEMKRRIGCEPQTSLNFYTCAPPDADDPDRKLLGYATMPHELNDYPEIDGVVLHYASLRGVADPLPGAERGFTVVHEVGHWCGLAHTFERGCVPDGDGIQDTPYEAEAAEGCPMPPPPSSCPGEQGLNPVSNYMNYSDDDCMSEFTAGQIYSMNYIVNYWREDLQPEAPLVMRLRKELE